MLVTFKTKAHGDITMFGDVAVKLLKIMGHSGTVPSAFKPRDLSGALQRLKAAAATDRTESDEGRVADQQDGDEEEPVTLRNRALPLIELLEAAEKSQVHVMWES
jgi:hypothetical protein